MKSFSLTAFFILLIHVSSAQTFAGYTLIDYLRTAVHPDGCDPLPLTGPPDDSMWVNLAHGQKMTGTFGSNQTAQPGNWLLLESAFNMNTYSYDIRLMYNNSLYTPVVVLPYGLSNWSNAQHIAGRYTFSYSNTCKYDQSGQIPTWVARFSLSGSFSLTPLDTIKGIEITFNGSDPDIAGVYLGVGNGFVDAKDLLLSPDHVHLFPNPARNHFNLSCQDVTHLGSTCYRIIDEMGQTIEENYLNNLPVTINISRLPPGLYGIELMTTYGLLTKKFVKSE